MIAQFKKRGNAWCWQNSCCVDLHSAAHAHAKHNRYLFCQNVAENQLKFVWCSFVRSNCLNKFVYVCIPSSPIFLSMFSTSTNDVILMSVAVMIVQHLTVSAGSFDTLLMELHCKLMGQIYCSFLCNRKYYIQFTKI